MEYNRFLKRIIYSSWFLAAFPAAMVIYLLPSVGSKYSIQISAPVRDGYKLLFADLNSDSLSEEINLVEGSPYDFITVWTPNRHIYDQWNLADSINPEISNISFGNYDHDKYSEIYIFTHSGDSLFLNINEMLDPEGIRKNKLFIDRIGYYRGKISARLTSVGFYDVNGDGFDEFYFTVSSFYRLGPRKIYYYNVKTGNVVSSPSYGIIYHKAYLEDADGDGVPEIFGTQSASGNYVRSVLYSDSSCWFMVMTPELRFRFKPVEFPGFANGLLVKRYKDYNFRGYLVQLEVNGVDTISQRSRIMLYSTDGVEIRSRLTDEFVKTGMPRVYVVNSGLSDRIFVVGDKIYELNSLLETIRSFDFQFTTPVRSYETDIDGDNKREMILYSEREKKIAVFDSIFNKLTETEFSFPDINMTLFPYNGPGHLHRIYIVSGTNGYYLSLERKKYFLLGYFLHPFVYLAFVFFLGFIKDLAINQQKTRENLNNRLITLQLQGIKAQLDPHFTFNTLNSIASLIYLEDREKAYDYMLKFTELLRNMLKDAEKIYRSIGEEIDFVTTYLELEKLRFGDKFNFSIEVDDDITRQEPVPKLVLHTFSENAVKHGIMPAEKDGYIKIRVTREPNFIKLSVEDNGIGRKLSSGQSKSTGRGLMLTNEFYGILNSINKKQIKLVITDLYDKSGNPSGTMVEVWVPSEEFLRYPGS